MFCLKTKQQTIKTKNKNGGTQPTKYKIKQKKQYKNKTKK